MIFGTCRIWGRGMLTEGLRFGGSGAGDGVEFTCGVGAAGFSFVMVAGFSGFTGISFSMTTVAACLAAASSSAICLDWVRASCCYEISSTFGKKLSCGVASEYFVKHLVLFPLVFCTYF